MEQLRTLIEIFLRFLALGCISFGGPAAHIGYFQTNFVERLRWLNHDDYAKLVAVSQFLPGPGSSQIGFAIGLQRGGLAGGLAAFLGFTLPSFCLMLGLVFYLQTPTTNEWMAKISQGLMLLAVVVVADAILNMSKQFCQSIYTRCIAILSALILLSFTVAYLQIVLLFAAGLIGFIWHQSFVTTTPAVGKALNSKKTTVALMLFAMLFIASLVIQGYLNPLDSPILHLAASFYHSGSLVFGGGHVVLPLLQQNVANTLDTQQFLFGYAAAQGVPGPMFSLATYLGALLLPLSPLLGASLATLALFLPGLLLIYALHQQWALLSANVSMAGAMAAINAAVVGLLFSAWVNPVVSHGINQLSDVVVALLLLLAYRLFKLPIMLLILLSLTYALIY
jgi:chromate transporter